MQPGHSSGRSPNSGMGPSLCRSSTAYCDAGNLEQGGALVAITVVVVDDMGDSRMLIRQIISDDPELLVVGEAGTGTEALFVVGQNRPDVVLVDHEMPDMNGLETAALILAAHPEQTIVLLSTQLDEALRNRAEHVGVTSCLSKFLLRDLRDVLRQAGSLGRSGS